MPAWALLLGFCSGNLHRDYEGNFAPALLSTQFRTKAMLLRFHNWLTVSTSHSISPLSSPGLEHSKASRQGEEKMNSGNLTVDISPLWGYIQLVGCAMIGLTALGLILIRIWIAFQATVKVQRKTQWSVPQNLESESTRIVFSRPSRPAAFAHQRVIASSRKANLRRSA